MIAERFNLITGDLIGAIPPDYAQPQVRVTLDSPTATAPPATGGYINLSDVAEAARAVGKTSPARMVAPIAADEGARAFYSFSRLSGALRPATELETNAAWAEATDDDYQTEGAAELGKLVHAVMAQMDFTATHTVDVAALVRREADRRFATPAEHITTAIEMASRFAKSARAAEFRTAQALHRELEFLLAWPPGASGKSPASKPAAAAPRRLQGFIDCLVQNASGAWEVIDFKTNHVAAAAVPQAALQYEPQMLLYALAVEEILGQSPQRLTLHFMHPGVEHTFEWNAAAREKTIALVSKALATVSTRKLSHP